LKEELRNDANTLDLKAQGISKDQIEFKKVYKFSTKKPIECPILFYFGSCARFEGR
jgi:hypothetical protein